MEEKEKNPGMETETEQGGDEKENEQDYEKICYICRRPESTAGSMIEIGRAHV